MITEPFGAKQVNLVWKEAGWPAEIGWYEAFGLAGAWEPYQRIKISGKGWVIFFDSDPWEVVAFDDEDRLGTTVITPPSVAVFAVGQGEKPGERIRAAAETVEVLSGVINLTLGQGLPVLRRLRRGPYYKSKETPDKIKYYDARTELSIEGLTTNKIVAALNAVDGRSLDQIPVNVRLALRWYAKGIAEDNGVDKFIALYESCLAVVAPWHYNMHREAYVNEDDPEKGRDPPPRRMFGDWVRDVLSPQTDEEEKQRFQSFHRMVGTRNSILKGGKLWLDEEDINCAISDAVQLLHWGLARLLPTESP